MKASTSFILRTLVIAGVSVGLGLAFNATRPDGLRLDQIRETPARTAPAPEAASTDGAEPTEHEQVGVDAASNHTQAASAAENASLEVDASPATDAPSAANASETLNASTTGNASLAAPEEPGLEEDVQSAANMTDPVATDMSDEVAAALSREISLEDAAALFAEGRALFVDARDAQSYADGHVQGAISLPLMTFPQGLDEIRHGLDGMTVITYCDGERCTLSRDLAEALRVEGVENVRELRNGWTLWQEHGLPTAAENGGGHS